MPQASDQLLPTLEEARGLARQLAATNEDLDFVFDLAESTEGRTLARELAATSEGRALAFDLATSAVGRDFVFDLATSTEGVDFDFVFDLAESGTLARQLATTNEGRAFVFELATSVGKRILDLAKRSEGRALPFGATRSGFGFELAESTEDRDFALAFARDFDLVASTGGRPLARTVVNDLAASNQGHTVALQLAASNEGRALALQLVASNEGRTVALQLAASNEGTNLARQLARNPDISALLRKSQGEDLVGGLLVAAAVVWWGFVAVGAANAASVMAVVHAFRRRQPEDSGLAADDGWPVLSRVDPAGPDLDLYVQSVMEGPAAKLRALIFDESFGTDGPTLEQAELELDRLTKACYPTDPDTAVNATLVRVAVDEVVRRIESVEEVPESISAAREEVAAVADDGHDMEHAHAAADAMTAAIADAELDPDLEPDDDQWDAFITSIPELEEHRDQGWAAAFGWIQANRREVLERLVGWIGSKALPGNHLSRFGGGAAVLSFFFGIGPASATAAVIVAVFGVLEHFFKPDDQ